MTIVASLRDFHRLDLLAAGDSALHRLDARAKLVAIVAFIIGAMSYPRYAVTELLPWFAVPLALALGAGLPVGFIARRALVVLPFAVVVGIANPWFDQAPISHLGSLAIAGGWFSFASIVLRSLLAAAAALVLVALTGFPAIAVALERLAVPRALVVQLLLLYRYLTLLGDEWQRIAAARAARGGGTPLALAGFGTLAGNLLLRSADRAGRIYVAMRARGFDGSFPAAAPLHFGRSDGVFLLAVLGVVVVLRFGDAPQRLGALLLGRWG
jgi:cobalt/nickel transport system permease protein